MLDAIMQNATLALAVLFGISEALALIPSVKANSVFQAVYNGLKFLKDKVMPSLPKPPEPPAQ
jgi:hypothetical protein